MGQTRFVDAADEGASGLEALDEVVPCGRREFLEAGSV
jgi:hypothetical protein